MALWQVVLLLALFLPGFSRGFELIAHRGVHQTYSRAGLDDRTCTASRIFPPQHHYLENTIESIRAAFRYGADRVEIDVHPTIDGEMVVFHDWTLDCRTDGTGVTHERTLAYLKSLDIGYGYTADDGETFPFRGAGVGKMPTLQEVLATFPTGKLIINQKDRSPRTVEILADIIGERRAAQRRRLAYWGDPETYAELKARVPEIGPNVFHRGTVRSCLVRYGLYGWTGRFPTVCRDLNVVVPARYARYVWGWPDLLRKRAHSHGSTVTLWVMVDAPEAPALAMRSRGLDFIMVEQIERYGPLLRSGREEASRPTLSAAPTRP
ncbi:MAG: glycerophosphodiester phosphodiesterase family protein [Myxococcota bacterium]